MRLEYRIDVPLGGNYNTFIPTERLIRHRDAVMGNLAAQLNVLLDGETDRELSSIYERPLSGSSRYLRPYIKELREAAGGYIAHSLYFNMLCENNGGKSPSLAFAELLKKSFASVEGFSCAFRDMARENIGSGFLWLCAEKHRGSGALKLLYTKNHLLPPDRYRRILALDLWEHAYLDTYGTDVGKYAACYLAAVDWDRVV